MADYNLTVVITQSLLTLAHAGPASADTAKALARLLVDMQQRIEKLERQING